MKASHIVTWALVLGALSYWGIESFNDLPKRNTTVVVDVSSIEADRTIFFEACALWHRSMRSHKDPETIKSAEAISRIAAKGYRKPLTLMGQHHATIAREYPVTSLEYKLNYSLARDYWLKSASLGDYFSMQILAGNYIIVEPYSIAEAAIWSSVALHFSPPHDAYPVKGVTEKLAMLSPNEQVLVKNRVDSIIAQIKSSKEEYDSLVPRDLEYAPK